MIAACPLPEDTKKLKTEFIINIPSAVATGGSADNGCDSVFTSVSSICPFSNNQRDGYNQMFIHKGQTAHHINHMNDNQPEPLNPEEGGYEHYHEKVEGRKIQARSDSFKDHFSQAKLFLNSLSKDEKQHLYDAFSFELGKCDMEIRELAINNLLNNIDRDLTEYVADHVGVPVPPENNEST
ncbi:hypothetical protein GCM10007275_16690 [Jeotgalicoccus coquinae]|nr:catalase-related domain-containing protein [Jeotgalicoccus coquinae]GGE22288.1 hypothetical protein GCM10007275_16690 [Jeotgalicoccus coquinae]